MPRHQATPIRRATGCLWATAGCRLGTDEELRQYVYGNKELDS